MRDQIVDRDRLERELDGRERGIAYTTGRIAEGKVRDAKIAYRGIADGVWAKARLEYSLGAPIDNVVSRFRESFDYLVEHDERLVDGEDPGVRAAVAALCGFTDITEALLQKSAGGASRVHDLLIGRPEAADISNYQRLTSKWAVRSRNLIETCLHDPDNASDELGAYVSNHWYRASRNRPWWDSHKKNHGYNGYWCFLGAAIARVTGTDDSALEGHRYYPYELAHYLDTNPSVR